ncbi:hypothetical protein [Spiroplasma endosymbiont of Acasis viretata]|uniref:hypothetical protein n=1 Tax=Spiroplasma endosymbiont of Acasis viretata TaxID=3066306 RepID=UPI00313B32F0
MATIDKTKSQTYNFLSKNKSIEEIKKQTNIEVLEKSRHGGSAFKIIEKDDANNQLVNNDLSEINQENLEPIATSLTNNEKEQETNNDIWTKLTNYLNLPKPNAEELIQVQRKIQELKKEIQQLKKENEELKLKQGNVNFAKFKYNAITIYDEKQRKDTGIEKIHEEILPINNELYFITTFVNANKSITEEILTFHNINDDSLKIIKQTKYYKNINEYKSNIFLIDEQNQNLKKITAKDFLKQQQDFKLKPNKKEWKTWGIIIGITLFFAVVVPICTFVIPALIPATATALLLETKVIIAVSFAVAGIVFKEISSLYENATQKVKSWFRNKYFKSTNQKVKEKKEREAIIKNLTSDKKEIKLETKYKILKQELDNRKEKNTNELSNNIINHNLNNISENLDIKSENNQNFDSSIRNTVNQQEQLLATTSNHNWNKVKCLLT